MPLGAYVSATETARRIRVLLAERFTLAELSRRLGRRSRLSVPRDRCRLKTVLKVRRLYRELMAGAEGVESK